MHEGAFQLRFLREDLKSNDPASVLRVRKTPFAVGQHLFDAKEEKAAAALTTMEEDGETELEQEEEEEKEDVQTRRSHR